ncbi:hypothetical protein AX15_002135 [Amanita polypyramis BW_CC]|nr:hypothetical protein AX15_002135 [Amanita polypyramis BW_CC]
MASQQQQQQVPPFSYPIGSEYAQQQQTENTQAQNQNGTGNMSQSSPSQSRQTAEEARKDRTLAEFLLMLDEYEPLIPNEVTDYFLQRVGFECEDARLKRLLSLAAQKFVSDIAADAYQHARIRTNASGGRARAPLTGQGSAKDKTRTTLIMDDLSAALAEYGISARKPEFYM